jgi:hypothetical protein
MPQLLDPEFELRPERLVSSLFQLLLDLFDLPFVFAELCLTNGRDARAFVRQIDARPLAEMEAPDPIFELLIRSGALVIAREVSAAAESLVSRETSSIYNRGASA